MGACKGLFSHLEIRQKVFRRNKGKRKKKTEEEEEEEMKKKSDKVWRRRMQNNVTYTPLNSNQESQIHFNGVRLRDRFNVWNLMIINKLYF